jgi:hypothetical protein
MSAALGEQKKRPMFRLFQKLCVSFLFICSRTMAMATMDMVSAGGFSGVGF